MWDPHIKNISLQKLLEESTDITEDIVEAHNLTNIVVTPKSRNELIDDTSSKLHGLELTFLQQNIPTAARFVDPSFLYKNSWFLALYADLTKNAYHDTVDYIYRSVTTDNFSYNSLVTTFNIVKLIQKQQTFINKIDKQKCQIRAYIIKNYNIRPLMLSKLLLLIYNLQLISLNDHSYLFFDEAVVNYNTIFCFDYAKLVELFLFIFILSYGFWHLDAIKNTTYVVDFIGSTAADFANTVYSDIPFVQYGLGQTSSTIYYNELDANAIDENNPLDMLHKYDNLILNVSNTSTEFSAESSDKDPLTKRSLKKWGLHEDDNTVLPKINKSALIKNRNTILDLVEDHMFSDEVLTSVSFSHQTYDTSDSSTNNSQWSSTDPSSSPELLFINSSELKNPSAQIINRIYLNTLSKAKIYTISKDVITYFPNSELTYQLQDKIFNNTLVGKRNSLENDTVTTQQSLGYLTESTDARSSDSKQEQLLLYSSSTDNTSISEDSVFKDRLADYQFTYSQYATFKNPDVFLNRPFVLTRINTLNNIRYTVVYGGSIENLIWNDFIINNTTWKLLNTRHLFVAQMTSLLSWLSDETGDILVQRNTPIYNIINHYGIMNEASYYHFREILKYQLLRSGVSLLNVNINAKYSSNSNKIRLTWYKQPNNHRTAVLNSQFSITHVAVEDSEISKALFRNEISVQIIDNNVNNKIMYRKCIKYIRTLNIDDDPLDTVDQPSINQKVEWLVEDLLNNVIILNNKQSTKYFQYVMQKIQNVINTSKYYQISTDTTTGSTTEDELTPENQFSKLLLSLSGNITSTYQKTIFHEATIKTKSLTKNKNQQNTDFFYSQSKSNNQQL